MRKGISPDLLAILACPKCKGTVNLTRNDDGLVCLRCQLVYEIREGIPVMLIEEAKPLAGFSGQDDRND